MIENVASWLYAIYKYEGGVAIMIPNGKQYKVWFLLTAISLLIAGCAPSPEEALDPVGLEEHNPEVRPSSKPSLDLHTDNDLTVSSPSQSEHGADADNNTSPKGSSVEDVVVADETPAENKQTDTKVYNVTEAFDASNPTLMGFTIHDTLNKVLDRFETPVSESIMNDGTEHLRIYEYPGFIFGFDNMDKIVFIEVNSSEVNPGLNDLHIGQTVEHARTALGTPESLNEYVMIYSSNQVIMKLDIDPHSSTIRSIKLFAE